MLLFKGIFLGPRGVSSKERKKAHQYDEITRFDPASYRARLKIRNLLMTGTTPACGRSSPDFSWSLSIFCRFVLGTHGTPQVFFVHSTCILLQKSQNPQCATVPHSHFIPECQKSRSRESCVLRHDSLRMHASQHKCFLFFTCVSSNLMRGNGLKEFDASGFRD